MTTFEENKNKIIELEALSESYGNLGRVTTDIDKLISSFNSKFDVTEEKLNLMFSLDPSLKVEYENLLNLSNEYKTKLDEIKNATDAVVSGHSTEAITEAIEYFNRFSGVIDETSESFTNLSSEVQSVLKKFNTAGFDTSKIEDVNKLNSELLNLDKQRREAVKNIAISHSKVNAEIEKSEKTLDTILKLSKLVWNEIKEGGNKWIEIDDKLTKVGRTIGLSTQQIRGYQENILDNYGRMAQRLGMTFEELFKFQEQYTKNTGRAVSLTNEQTMALASVSKMVGETATEEMVKNMDDFGASTQTATSYLALNMARARSQGLDAQKASETFAKNVKLASKYTFREGINGISKMTLLSQKLKFNMDSIANAAEKFETVEGAIGTAANLQMLGGTYSVQFGNPLEAMNMAMLDMEGFTQKIIDTFSGKATFNRETGQVEMSAIDKRLMREAAKQMGISYEEAWNMASQKARIGDVERQINKTQNFSEEDKSWITSKAQYNAETKQHYVTIYQDGKEKNIDVSNLTEKELEIAKEQSDIDKLMQRDIHDIHGKLNTYIISQAKDNKSLQEAMKGNKEWWDIGKANSLDYFMNAGKGVLSSESGGWIQGVGNFALGAGSILIGDLIKNKAESFAIKSISKIRNWNNSGAPSGSGGSSGSSGSGGSGGSSGPSGPGGSRGRKPKISIGKKGKIGLAVGAALTLGAFFMSAADGSQVDKSKLGGREVEPINNENENENITSSVNQQSQELIELQKHTALLQAIANKQGIDVKTIYENSTFNKTDIEDNSEQTTASSILSDSMNTTLTTAQVGSSKIAAKGLKAVAGRSGLKMAANMGKMAKASNPLGWISLGSSVLKDVSGVKEGSGVDKAWSTANAALDGAALGGMIGSVIPGLGTAVGTAVGAAVGGVVGIIDNYGEDIAKATKSVVDGVSGFLFGEDNMTEADKMQQSYEETKLGVVDISDPQLEQKAYVATCKIHDVVISMWHHMNGKQSNGLKEDKGLFGSLFSGNEEKIENNNELLNNFTEKAYYNDETKQVEMSAYDKRLMKNVAKQLNISYDDALSMVSQNVINYNAYANENPYNTQNYKNSDLTNTNEVNYRNNSYLSEVSVKDINYNNDNVIPKVSVGLPTPINETSVNNYNNSSYNNIGSNKLDLNVSGTIKLTSERGGNVDIDFNKLLNNTEFMNNLINIISQDFNKRVNGQRENKNSVVSLQNGGYNYNIFNATTNGWA